MPSQDKLVSLHSFGRVCLRLDLHLPLSLSSGDGRQYASFHRVFKAFATCCSASVTNADVRPYGHRHSISGDNVFQSALVTCLSFFNSGKKGFHLA